VRRVVILPVRAYAVGSAVDQEGIAAGMVFRQVHGGKQMNPVPHGDPVLIFCVMLLISKAAGVADSCAGPRHLAKASSRAQRVQLRKDKHIGIGLLSNRPEAA
jgi:hypothetical protein